MEQGGEGGEVRKQVQTAVGIKAQQIIYEKQLSQIKLCVTHLAKCTNDMNVSKVERN